MKYAKLARDSVFLFVLKYGGELLIAIEHKIEIVYKVNSLVDHRN